MTCIPNAGVETVAGVLHLGKPGVGKERFPEYADMFFTYSTQKSSLI
jgi:hypothetical protein